MDKPESCTEADNLHAPAIDTPNRWRRFCVVFIVLMLCMGLRVFILREATSIARDGVSYTAMAREMQGDFLSGLSSRNYHPGYPILIYIFHPVIETINPAQSRADNLGNWELSGQVVSFVSSALAMFLMYLLARRAFGVRTGVLTLVIMGFWRKWAILGADVLSDSPALVFALLCCWASIKCAGYFGQRNIDIKTGKKDLRPFLWAFVVGISAGVGYWIRGDVLAAFIAALIMWVFLTWRDRGISWPRLAAVCCVAVAAAAAAILPYIILTARATPKKVIGLGVQRSVEIDPWFFKSIEQFSQAQGPILAIFSVMWLLWQFIRWRKSRTGPLEPAGELEMRSLLGVYVSAAAMVSVPVIVLHYINTGFLSYRYFLFLAAISAPMGAAMAGAIFNWIAGLLPVRKIYSLTLLTSILGTVIAVHAARPIHSSSEIYSIAGSKIARIADGEMPILVDQRIVKHYCQSKQEILRHKKISREYIAERLGEFTGRTVILSLSDLTFRRIENLPDGFEYELLENFEDEDRFVRVYKVAVPLR